MAASPGRRGKMEKTKCVIVGGADIGDYKRIRRFIADDDYVIYCDSGLRHMAGLGVQPSLIIGDFDSYNDPGMDVETITLPVAKDDTDTVFAVKEGMRRGFGDFLLAGVMGARLDHTLVNAYILTTLKNRGCRGLIIDDYSEIELLGADDPCCESAAEAAASVDDSYPFFSLVAMEGPARGVTIRNAKFPLEDAEITADYQYATSNEVLPGKTAEISLKEGRLLLIKVVSDRR